MALDIRSMACNYLRAGKVTVKVALPGPGHLPAQVEAVVAGNSATYRTELIDGRWHCSCGEPDACAHVAAVQLCTGHDGLASPAGRKALTGSGETP